jgi:metal-responsive CopG/Arc/MetJ family transcriptional regulator
MDVAVAHVRIKRDLLERVDRFAADTLRTRSNAIVALTAEALRRHEVEREDER